MNSFWEAEGAGSAGGAGSAVSSSSGRPPAAAAEPEGWLCSWRVGGSCAEAVVDGWGAEDGGCGAAAEGGGGGQVPAVGALAGGAVAAEALALVRCCWKRGSLPVLRETECGSCGSVRFLAAPGPVRVRWADPDMDAASRLAEGSGGGGGAAAAVEDGAAAP